MAQEIKKSNTTGAMMDPLSDMRMEMDRLVDAMLGRGLARPFSALGSRPAASMPNMDIKETVEALIVTAELPGMDESDVSVTVRDGVLTLKGEKKSEHDETTDDVHVSERTYGAFTRSFRLPDTIDDNKIVAAFDKGVLTINLPKGDTAKPEKKIPIGRT
ncbi:MAG: Hsp20/alpha crystallin family protein [Pseudomonadota bacterium]